MGLPTGTRVRDDTEGSEPGGKGGAGAGDVWWYVASQNPAFLITGKKSGQKIQPLTGVVLWESLVFDLTSSICVVSHVLLTYGSSLVLLIVYPR